MPHYKVVGKIEARVTKYVEAADPEAAFAAACDAWEFDDLDASEGSVIYDPSITEVPETTSETHYGPTAPAAWFAPGGDDPAAPLAS
jgi:hypothetical protein